MVSSMDFAQFMARYGLMLDAQDKTYGDGLDPALRHPYMWICKSHYYRGSLSYYNNRFNGGWLSAEQPKSPRASCSK